VSITSENNQLVRKDMDINEHQRRMTIAIQHYTSKDINSSKGTVHLLLLYEIAKMCILQL
jgi:hypothetical protein